jgi:hypothetical protein
MELQDTHVTELTGPNQHGFKKVEDEGKYGLLSILDSSSTFDVVNIALIIKGLNIIESLRMW